MLLRNSNSIIRNINLSYQLIDYQIYFGVKERFGQDKEHSNRIKLNP
jgi:hypothetical protein